MPLPITALYAGLLALVGVVLQQLVGRERMRTEISIGDGGDPQVLAAMRRQANFVEQVPLALILLALLELNGASAAWVHALGAILLVARIVHPFGIDASNMRYPTRAIGAIGTLGMVVVASFKLLSMTLL